MIISKEPNEYSRKIAIPFAVLLMGVTFDICTSQIALLLGFSEGNINFNPFMELLVTYTAMAFGVILYNHTKSERIYKSLILISSITFIPALINISIMIGLASFISL